MIRPPKPAGKVWRREPDKERMYMKLLVLSDSHGHDEILTNMILEHPEADALVFLGDGEWDFENALKVCSVGAEKTVCQVKGNCDFSSREPGKIIREFDGVRFFITHGHGQNVKMGLWGLVDEAKKNHCRVALFGHTHRRHVSEKEGILLINPGSAADNSFCLVEIKDGKVSVPE